MKNTTVRIGVLVFFYLVSYLVLMTRNTPAADEHGNTMFRSSFRFGQGVKSRGDLTIIVGKVTILNYIYCPLDYVYFSVQKK
jgi:hypothetical protein